MKTGTQTARKIKDLTKQQYEASEALKGAYKKACLAQGTHFEAVPNVFDWGHESAKKVIRLQKRFDKLIHNRK